MNSGQTSNGRNDGADEAELFGRIKRGDRSALARAISYVESNSSSLTRLGALPVKGSRPAVIGLTGAPAVGKSSLLAAISAEMAKRGLKVAILAVDPTSPTSGGAVLGDRIRMLAQNASTNIFFRSLATKGALGGLSVAIPRVLDLLALADWDFCLLETVGVGQSEVDVANIADCITVVCAPGFGDGVQAIKAGLLEIADVYLVNKADQPDAARVVNELQGSMTLGDTSAARPLFKTVATKSAGIAEFVDWLIDFNRNGPSPERRRKHLSYYVVQEVELLLKQRLAALASDVVAKAVQGLDSNTISRSQAVEAILSAVLQR